MDSNWAYIAGDSKSRFDDSARDRGWDYYEGGRVTLRTLGAHQAQSTVQGTRLYNVDIRITLSDPIIDEDGDEQVDREVHPSCDCPAATEAPCKHMYATLLELEVRAQQKGNAALITPPPVPEKSSHRSPSRNSVLGPARSSPKWQRQLDQLDPPAPRDPWASVPGASARLHIVLCKTATVAMNHPVLRIMYRTRQKNNEWSTPKDLHPDRPIPRFDAEGELLFARASGISIDRAETWDPYTAHYDGLDEKVLRGADAHDALVAFAQYGGLQLGQTYGRPDDKQVGYDRDGAFAFAMKLAIDDNDVSLTGEFTREKRRVPMKEPQIILDCGLMVIDEMLTEVDYSGAWNWARQLRQLGDIEIPMDGYAQLVGRLLEHGSPLPLEGSLPLPSHTDEGAPRAKGALHLHTDQNPMNLLEAIEGDLQPGNSAPPDVVPGDVRFRYGTAEIDAKSPADRCMEPKTGAVILRDFVQENALLERLLDLGATASEGNSVHTAMLPEQNAIRIASTLQREGWKISTDGHAWKQADDFKLRVSSGIDWFDLAGGLRYDEETVGIPEILQALRSGDGAVTLADGSRGLLPEGLAERLGLFGDLAKQRADGLRFTKSQGWVLDALLTEQEVAIEADAGFQALRLRAASFEKIHAREVSDNFEGELRHYQCDALGWFHFLEEMELGGCLADDMGLGKTVMVLAHLLHLRNLSVKSAADLEKRGEKRGEEGGEDAGEDDSEFIPHRPSIVVAPKSLVWNWVEEAKRFAPDLKVLDYSGPAAERRPELIAEHDLVVTTYGVMRRDAERLHDQRFAYAILDEAQMVKNPASQSWKAVRLLQAEHRLALTGTPVENHLGDLWAIMEFLNPGMLGAKATHRMWSKSGSDGVELRDRVAKLVKPVLLRRTKEEVLQELPPRQETLLHCEMGERQQKVYDDLRSHYRETLLDRIDNDGIGKTKMHVLEALLRLRQVACHPGLIDGEQADQPSAKFDALLPRLEEVKEAGSKALVFSQFTSLLSILKDRLDAEGIAYTYLDGKSRRRNELVDAFQNDPDVPLFLISLKAGGVGLNLTAADHVFLLDPWWNPAVERQAVDRAHRIGQTKVVNVYRLVTEGTVEERILDLQDKKRELAEAIVGTDSGLLKKLSRDDLAALLEG
jgi:hypothetical protein